jgi:hypothetical protein
MQNKCKTNALCDCIKTKMQKQCDAKVQNKCKNARGNYGKLRGNYGTLRKLRTPCRSPPTYSLPRPPAPIWAKRNHLAGKSIYIICSSPFFYGCQKHLDKLSSPILPLSRQKYIGFSPLPKPATPKAEILSKIGWGHRLAASQWSANSGNKHK